MFRAWFCNVNCDLRPSQNRELSASVQNFGFFRGGVGCLRFQGSVAGRGGAHEAAEEVWGAAGLAGYRTRCSKGRGSAGRWNGGSTAMVGDGFGRERELAWRCAGGVGIGFLSSGGGDGEAFCRSRRGDRLSANCSNNRRNCCWGSSMRIDRGGVKRNWLARSSMNSWSWSSVRIVQQHPDIRRFQPHQIGAVLDHAIVALVRRHDLPSVWDMKSSSFAAKAACVHFVPRSLPEQPVVPQGRYAGRRKHPTPVRL